MYRIEKWFNESCSKEAEYVSFSFILMESDLLKKNSPGRKTDGKSINEQEEKKEK